jgi:nucleoside 2-deoxyribosyltransferase
MGRSMFLAGPFTGTIEASTGVMSRSHRSRIGRLLDYFEGSGWQVFNAHRRESWGQDWYEPEICTPLDFKEIRQADVLVAFPGYPPSPGTHVEIGWATVMGKPIFLILEPDVEPAALISGLHTVATVVYSTYRDDYSYLPELQSELLSLLERSRNRSNDDAALR